MVGASNKYPFGMGTGAALESLSFFCFHVFHCLICCVESKGVGGIGRDRVIDMPGCERECEMQILNFYLVCFGLVGFGIGLGMG